MNERIYRIHVAAELTGLSEQLIRAWERRYGILKPRRTPGGYRVYTERDIALLRRLKQLTEEGVSISEASKLVPSLRKELEALPATVADAPVSGTQVEQWRKEILLAAERLDQQAVEGVLDRAFATLSPLQVYDELLVPTQQEVGDRWHTGVFTVAEEHLVSQVLRMRLLSVLHASPRGARKHVVCACMPEEDHEVGLLGAALRFRHAGFRVTLLGPRTPPEHLARVVRSLKPSFVALSAVNDPGEKELRAQLSAVLAALPQGTKVVLGGRGARAHAALCEKLGAAVVESTEAWAKLLA